jgi:DNA mismatch endonuclease (patch repair protein)
MSTFDSDLERAVALEFDRVGLETGSYPEVLPGRPDFVIRGANIAVFVHGCYWHRHYKCRLSRKSGRVLTPRVEKLSRSVLRDDFVRKELRRAGWSVAVLWECSIRQDLSAVVRDLKNRVETCSHESKSSMPWLFVA